MSTTAYGYEADYLAQNTRTIRDYLEAKLELGEKEWLRREPRTTHREILNIVRCFRITSEVYGRVAYNDDAERAVEKEAGNLPDHYPHAHEKRHPLTNQLGHEVYIAQCICHDENNIRQAARLEAEGFVPITEAKHGTRYDVATATLYSGNDYPTYGRVQEKCRVYSIDAPDRVVFLPFKSRVNGFYSDRHTLIREVS